MTKHLFQPSGAEELRSAMIATDATEYSGRAERGGWDRIWGAEISDMAEVRIPSGVKSMKMTRSARLAPSADHANGAKQQWCWRGDENSYEEVELKGIRGGNPSDSQPVSTTEYFENEGV
jgi:hypothetical protein